MFDHLNPVIGLEIHVQLKTETKLFCACDNHADNAAPNTLVCPICIGHPGTLPNPNTEAIRFAIRTGLALNCTINSPIFFDRKHYIYPDLPKGYQISQFDVPVAEEGYLMVGEDRIGIERAHLEEDAAKNTHRDGKTLVDFNRAGTPLVEIVTKPDFTSAKQAKAFLQELRRTMRYIGVSDADMEKGHMRCDANISLRPVDKEGNPTGHLFYPKTEVKNMNSFKSVERALEYEISRQTKLWQEGTPPDTNTTRGWHDEKQVTILQRTKELAADYRFMREPDIPPTDTKYLCREEKDHMPELPSERRERFSTEYGFKAMDINTLTEDPALADFVEATMSELYAWLVSLPDVEGSIEEIQERHREKIAKIASTWIGTKLIGLLGTRSGDVRTMHVTPENMAELMAMVYERRLNNHGALKVLESMLDTGGDPSDIVDQMNLSSVGDESSLRPVVEGVLAAFPDQVQEYMAGKDTLLKFFIGQVLKETKGNADPQIAQDLIVAVLDGNDLT